MESESARDGDPFEAQLAARPASLATTIRADDRRGAGDCPLASDWVADGSAGYPRPGQRFAVAPRGGADQDLLESDAPGGSMRFTDEFEIKRTKADDWFDLECTEDTPLYVDPFLVFGDPDPFWSSTHDRVVEFFGMAMDYVSQSSADPESAHWRKAERMLTFPEPKEFALGLSMGHPEGSGTGADIARRMAEALDILHRSQVPELGYIEAFTLFCEGMGVDRISDAFCNIVKAKFIEYTINVVKRRRISTQALIVKHSSWDRFGRWNDARIQIPRSPVTTGGILLVPERFLKDIPRVTPERFWSWAENNVASVLREDLNYDLHQSLNRKERAAAGRGVARKRPDLALRFVDEISESDLRPYDVQNDPRLLVGWAEAGRAAAIGSANPLGVPQSQTDFRGWVRELAVEFKIQIEDTDLWKVLWDSDLRKHRDEKIVQAVAGSMWVQRCKAADVDISKEPNMGRGPVDFKFSAGWSRRALVEVKFINSTKFFTGASKQLPQYLRTERIDCGYYLCVGFSDADFNQGRLDKVIETCTALSSAKGVSIEPIFVDARHDNKPSASTIKLDKEK